MKATQIERAKDLFAAMCESGPTDDLIEQVAELWLYYGDCSICPAHGRECGDDKCLYGKQCKEAVSSWIKENRYGTGFKHRSDH